MRSDYFWIAVTAITWGSYPLVARWSGYEGPRATLILMLTGFVPVALMVYFSPDAGWPTRGGVWKLLIAGLLMGVGLVAFMRVASGSMEASISIPMVDVAMLIVSAVGAMVFFSEPVSLQKALGILLMLTGIGLLRPG